jgi:hypothetical protein
LIPKGNDQVNTKKVVLGTSNRPSPSKGYARQRIGIGEDLPKKVANSKFGGVSPSLRGEPTPPHFSENESEEIITAWRQLNRMQQRAMLAKMSLELQQGPSAEESRDVDLWSDAVYSALRDAIGPSDASGHGPQVVRRLMGASSAWAPVAEFITNGRLDKLRPAERMAVFGLLAKLLVARAKRVAARADIPLSAKLVAQNTPHIAGIFDNAFPGYLANGLIGSVSRMLIGAKANAPRVRLND